MKKYIDVSEFIGVVRFSLDSIRENVSGAFYTGANTVLKALEEYAANKNTTVVHCKECEHFERENDYCSFHEMGIYADDFCSYGRTETEAE